MSIITVIKKIGEKILSIVEYPIKHAVEIEELIATGLADEPAVKTAIVGLVSQFESLSADTVAAVAAGGANIVADVKTVQEVQQLFAYFTGTFVPAIEKAYTDLKSDLPATSSTATTVAVPAADAVQTGPGLHAVTAA